MTTIAQVAEIVDRASSDATFRQQLLSDPAATLRSAGIDVSSSIQVLENTSSLVHLVLPPRPDDVSDADLEQTGETKTGGSSVALNMDALGALLIETWADDDLKSRLLEDPLSVLAERGISIPYATVRAVEATSDLSYLVIPPSSTGGAA